MLDVAGLLSVKAAQFLLLGVGSFGLLLLWFVADVLAKVVSYMGSGPQGHVHPFTNLWIAMVMLTAADHSQVFIPAQARRGLRVFAIFLIYFMVDSAMCALHVYTKMGNPGDLVVTDYPQFRNQRNLARFGAGLVVFSAVISLFLALFKQRPDVTPLTRGGPTAIGHIVRSAAMLFIFLAQIIAWSIKTSCAGELWTDAAGIMSQYTLFMQLLLMVSANFFGCRDAFDIAIILMARNIFQFAPLFSSEKAILQNQGNFPSLWRAEVSLMFIASIAYIASTLHDSKTTPLSRESASLAIRDRVRSMQFIVQGATLAVGFAAAVCVFTRSPEKGGTVTISTKTQAFYGCFAMFIPLMEMAATALANDAIHFFSLAFTPPIATFIGMTIIAPTTTGYLRGGLLLEMVVILTAILCRYAFAAPEMKCVTEYFAGENRIDVIISTVLLYFAALSFEAGDALFLMWATLALFILISALTRAYDMSRVAQMYLMVLMVMPGANLWPVLPTQSVSLLRCAYFLSGLIYNYKMTFQHSGKIFECFALYNSDEDEPASGDGADEKAVRLLHPSAERPSTPNYGGSSYGCFTEVRKDATNGSAGESEYLPVAESAPPPPRRSSSSSSSLAAAPSPAGDTPRDSGAHGKSDQSTRSSRADKSPSRSRRASVASQPAAQGSGGEGQAGDAVEEATVIEVRSRLGSVKDEEDTA